MIFVNARFLTQPITGVQRFAIETSFELLKSNPSVRFVTPKQILHREVADQLNIIQTGKGTGHFWEQFSLPSFLRKQGKHILLNLCNTAPLRHPRNVVVIHDLAFHSHPEWFTKTFAAWYNFLIPQVARSASLILTVSEFSKREIVQAWPETKEKIINVGNGLATVFRTAEPGSTKGRDEKIVLAFAGNNPRKNVSIVINGFKKLNDANCRLLLLGRHSNTFKSTISDELSDSRIELKADISDSELISYYKKADLLIYPSKYEGFGLPPLEALKFGCPSLLSDIPVFREIYNSSAFFLKQETDEGVCIGIQDALNNRAEAERRVQHGKGLLEKYTFRQVANNILSAVETLD